MYPVISTAVEMYPNIMKKEPNGKNIPKTVVSNITMNVIIANKPLQYMALPNFT